MEQKEKDHEAFIAQYWGQELLRCSHWNESRPNGTVNIFWLREYMSAEKHLSLHCLSSITDEEAIECCRIMDVDGNNAFESEAHFDLASATDWLESLFTHPAGYYIDGYTGNQLLSLIDYLRSIGILIPFRTYSIEEIIGLGWAKVKEEEK